MPSIIYVGMDVHTTNYALCCFTVEENKIFAETETQPDYTYIIKYLNKVDRLRGGGNTFICGYEAGPLGYSLYNQLTNYGIDCVILAPTSIPTTSRRDAKTDRRDAIKIAKCMAYNIYSPVYISTDEDHEVKEYIRMRNAAKGDLTRIKQRILAFCNRNGKYYTEGRNYWTLKHINWLKKQEFSPIKLQETYQELLIQLSQSMDRIERYDKRIEEMAETEPYKESVNKLTCFLGIKALTALSLLVETGDFNRFKTAGQFASYLGLAPGEDSSGVIVRRTGITKSGNSNLRRLLTESAQCYSRGAVGVKSRMIQRRQQGNDPVIIAYADKANERLKRKFYSLKFKKVHNVAVSAVARELACFVWGMMTGNIV